MTDINLDGFVQPIVSQFEAPQTISEGSTLQSNAWDGHHLKHTYLLSSRENVPSLDVARTSSCRGPIRVSILAFGGVLEYVYFAEGGEVASFRVALRTCFQ